MRSSLFCLIALVASGCGYTFQNSKNPVLESKGIHSIYVVPFKNNTFKAGVENLIYNDIVKTIAANRRVKLVLDPEQADAILKGAVTEANYSQASTTTADALKPAGKGSPSITVAVVYNAALACSFQLQENPKRSGSTSEGKLIWSGGFSRSKPFPAANQLEPLGSTSTLINQSEFEKMLAEISNSMMADLHESMLAMF